MNLSQIKLYINTVDPMTIEMSLEDMECLIDAALGHEDDFFWKLVHVINEALNDEIHA